MPPLHPLVVHFPIALFLAAVLFDTVTAFRARNVDQPFSDPRLARKELRRYDVATRLLLVFSLLGSAVAVLTGEWLKPARASFVPAKLLSLHQVLAFAFLAWLLILTILRLRLSWQPSKWYMMASFIGALLLGSVGYTGATMAWPASIVPVTASAQPGSTGGQQPGGVTTATTQTATGSASTRKKSSGSASGTGSSNQSQGTSRGTTGASGGNNGGSNAVVLQVGMTSAAVTTLQQELSALGLFHHSFTQYYGPVTETAVRAFQSQHGLPVTGSVDQSTLQSIQQAAASAPSGSTTGSGEEGGSGQPPAQNSTGSSTGTSSGGGSTQSNGIDQVRYNSGYQAFVNGCQSCHSLGVAEQYYGQLSPSQWSSIVSQMNSYAGGTIPNSSDIIYYLEHHK